MSNVEAKLVDHGFAADGQKLLQVALNGTNAPTSAYTYAGHFVNDTEGTGARNVGGYFSATNSSGDNYAILVPASGGRVGFGTITPNSKAMLDLTSTTQGFLPPRMTKAERTAMGLTTAHAGMVIYQTDNTPGLRVWNGANWMKFTEAADN
mgnify:FL=1